MRILGIGVDIVQNKRFKLLAKNKKFLERNFTKKEIRFSKNISNKINYFAKRFAAKESLAKSIGTGIGKNLHFKNIEILNERLGKPYFIKNKNINSIINKKFNVKNYDLFLSISDE